MADDDPSHDPELDTGDPSRTEHRRAVALRSTAVVAIAAVLVVAVVARRAPGRSVTRVAVGATEAPSGPTAAAEPAAAATTGTTGGGTATTGPAPRRASATSAVVPWLDEVVTTTAPTTTTEAPLTGTPCRSADLTGVLRWAGGAGGNTRYDIVLTNGGSSPCLLDGYPTLVGQAPDGSRVPLDAGHGTYFGDPGGRGQMEPGATTEAWLNTTGACPEATESTAAALSWTTLEVGLPGGGTVALASETDGASLSSVCGISVSRFGRSDRQAAPVEALPSPLAAIADPPTAVQRGTTLTYTVTVTNTSARAYSLEPCPTYTEYLTTFAEAPSDGNAPTAFGTVYDYRLNCKDRAYIAPHESITFVMQLDVPSGQYVGAGKFGWELHLPGVLGPFTGTEIIVTG